jgi:hypothetical protein
MSSRDQSRGVLRAGRWLLSRLPFDGWSLPGQELMKQNSSKRREVCRRVKEHSC